MSEHNLPAQALLHKRTSQTVSPSHSMYHVTCPHKAQTQLSAIWSNPIHSLALYITYLQYNTNKLAIIALMQIWNTVKIYARTIFILSQFVSVFCLTTFRHLIIKTHFATGYTNKLLSLNIKLIINCQLIN